MADFAWEARSRTGELRKGVMEADNQAAVENRLRQQQLNPVKVRKRGALGSFQIGSGVGPKEIVIFTRQFATMIDAGLPLVQCLDILANQQDNRIFQAALRDIKGHVEEGATFSDTLRRHPRIFDDLYSNLVQAGEVGGILDTILNRLAIYIEKNVKLVRQVRWRGSGRRELMLMVIAPLGYRLHQGGKLLYRKPAYLICTDPTLPLQTIIQDYFWRWDIEVNHRDEKQLIGLGEAQVRSPKSAERVPAFAVACYSMLLISAAKAFGLAAADPVVDQPKWLATSSRKPLRLSTRQLLRRLKRERLDAPSDLPNFDHFASHLARRMKLPKSAISLHQALHHAFN